MGVLADLDRSARVVPGRRRGVLARFVTLVLALVRSGCQKRAGSAVAQGAAGKASMRRRSTAIAFTCLVACATGGGEPTGDGGAPRDARGDSRPAPCGSEGESCCHAASCHSGL